MALLVANALDLLQLLVGLLTGILLGLLVAAGVLLGLCQIAPVVERGLFKDGPVLRIA